MTSYRKKTETFYSFQCSFFGMWSFWNVPYLEFARCHESLDVHPFTMLSLHYSLLGMCPLWNVPSLECPLFGMCPFWNVLFWECALFGMYSFENVLFLKFDSKVKGCTSKINCKEQIPNRAHLEFLY